MLVVSELLFIPFNDDILMQSIGMVLCNKTIRHMLLNFARSQTFSCAPSFLMVAALRTGYQLIMKGETQEVSAKDIFPGITVTCVSCPCPNHTRLKSEYNATSSTSLPP